MAGVWQSWEGKSADQYPLLQYLGATDSGAVFLTERRDNGHLQKAAIKLILADQTNAESQFVRWQQAIRLSHPHLMRIFQVGRYETGSTRVLFVLTEFAEENLGQLLPHRPLTPAEARDMLEPALDALAYLHKQGFVHGHLKPANFMANQDQLKLSADGLYKVGETVGIPTVASIYDPPETAKGVISPASDIWSLGVTLVEALTQHPPVWKSGEQSEPVLPQALPELFHDITRHCLMRDPQQRWSVAQISSRLNPTAPARKAFGSQPEPMPSEQSNWRRFLMPAIVGVLVVAALLSVIMFRRPAGNSRPASRAIGQSVSQAEPQHPKPSAEVEAVQTARSSPPVRAPKAEAAVGDHGPVSAEIVHEVVPSASRSARATIEGKVRVSVKVHVDSAGAVNSAEFVNPGPSKYFARLAIQAAQEWKFAAAPDASREWILKFAFGRAGTEVHPVRTTP